MKRTYILSISISLLLVGIFVFMWIQGVHQAPTSSIPSEEDGAVNATPVTVESRQSEMIENGVTYMLSIPVVQGAPVLQRAIDEYVEGFRSEIKKFAQDIEFEGASANYALYVSYKTLRQDSALVVIEMSAYVFTGGAHGNPSFAFLVYDPVANRMVSEKEIIQDKRNPELLARIAQNILQKKQYSFEDGGVSRSYFFNAEDKELFMQELSNASIAPTEKGVLFKYGVYEIGPYVIGEPEVEIAYTDVEQFLTPWAKALFN